MIEGLSGKDLADIAIDDVGFTDECIISSQILPPGTTVATTTQSPCPEENQFHCGDGACVFADRRCDGL